MATKKPAPELQAASAEYDANSLISLSPIEHIRKRPSLTLGPYDHMQLVALREPIDNSIDEFKAGHGKTIKITLYADGAASIEDSGRGVPTGINKQTGENGIYMAFGKVGSGGKFGAADSGYAATASLGLNGVGTTATNATSLRFDTIVFKGDGNIHRLSFQRGIPGHFADDSGPDAKFTPSMDVKVSKDTRTLKERKERPTGTTIKFWPDMAIFGNDSTFHVDELRETLRSTAFLVPGIRIIIDVQIENQVQFDDYEFDGGLVEMVETFALDKPLTKPVHVASYGSFTESVPVPQPDGSMKQQEVERKVEVDVAFRWGDGYEANLRSYANTLYTPLGGTHLQGFQRALSKTFLDVIKNGRFLKAKEESPILDDIQEGLTAIISISQSELSFVGQDKQRLGGTETGKVISAVLNRELKAWVEDKKNAPALKIIAAKIVEASRGRIQARQAKDTNRKKSQLESSANLPSKLVECKNPESEYSELLIVEGDSALGTMRAARDARFQALLPIRGKILNVQKATTDNMLANTECASIIQALGAGSGRSFNVDDSRYSKIIIAADADVDGSHIRVLLITFFWKYMRSFVEAGRLYSLIPPLFAVKVKGKGDEVIYAIDEVDLAEVTKKLDARKATYEIGRNKGLGEMDADPTWDTLLDPANRQLKQVTVGDLESASSMLELAMGDKVPPRKEWITVNRDKANSTVLDGL
jgi:DNA gyrase subunit B